MAVEQVAQFKSVSDLVTKVGLPVALSVVLVLAMVYLIFHQMTQANEDKKFQREQTDKMTTVVKENTVAIVEMRGAIKSLESEIRAAKR